MESIIKSSGDSHIHNHADMLTVEDAYSRILSKFQILGSEEKPIVDALGQVVVEDIVAPFDLPHSANSAMDGYAVRNADISKASAECPQWLQIIGQISAGESPSQYVKQGTAIRIMTGAPMPPGGDTVVPFESTNEYLQKGLGTNGATIGILEDLMYGSNVRPQGEDMRKGEVVLKKDTVIRGYEVGLLASLGMPYVEVVRRPVVAILATGNELTDLGSDLRLGKIYDSNSYGIAALVKRYGGIPKILGIAKDDFDSINMKLSNGLGTDLIITSAGVSKGDYDIVKEVLAERGDMDFWSVRMRPAKPLAFGTIKSTGRREVPLLGLPGNPVSAMVAFEEFARPAILMMLGYTNLEKPSVQAILEGSISNPDGRRVYARVRVERRGGIYYAKPTAHQGSNIITSMTGANGLAICPEEIDLLAEGRKVLVKMLDWNEEVQIGRD